LYAITVIPWNDVVFATVNDVYAKNVLDNDEDFWTPIFKEPSKEMLLKMSVVFVNTET